VNSCSYNISYAHKKVQEHFSRDWQKIVKVTRFTARFSKTQPLKRETKPSPKVFAEKISNTPKMHNTKINKSKYFKISTQKKRHQKKYVVLAQTL
jgi:hypothetical protein